MPHGGSHERTVKPNNRLTTPSSSPKNIDPSVNVPCNIGQCCDWRWSWTFGWYCAGTFIMNMNNCICTTNLVEPTQTSGVKGRKGGRIARKQMGGRLDDEIFCPSGNYSFDVYGNKICN